MLVGLTFTTTLAAAGIGSAGLAHSLQTTHQLRAELEQALDASATSLTSLQRQITSVAQVALQNHRALDLLTAEKGGTCLFLQEQCCFYVNESGVVEENINTLQNLRDKLHGDPDTLEAITPWWRSLLFTTLAPVLGPFIIICILLMLGPCFLRFLQERIHEASRVAFNQRLLQAPTYSPLPDKPETAHL